MASVSNDPGGRKRILFVDLNGERRAIRFGKASQRAAETVALRIEHLLVAKNTGEPIDQETARWVAGLNTKLAAKLVKFGLIETPEAKRVVTLGEHLESYFAKRSDVRQGTLTNWGHTRRCLLEFFGAGKALTSITIGDARDFERWLRNGKARTNAYAGTLKTEGLAHNTVRRRCGLAKQFFEDAVSRGLLSSNPFSGLKSNVGSNSDRVAFISREDTAKLIDAAPDAQWRLIIALARYGGLRCPSEILALRLDDVNWETGRVLIRSPKTEHHEGKAYRIIPLFPELREHLLQVAEQAEPGTEYFITRYRDPKQNLRTTFQKIIARAGLAPWPKLFQNLRASRATELAKENPPHVAAAWLGHSTLIAQKHYWQVTDADYERASGAANEAPEKAAHKAAQQTHALTRSDSHPAWTESRNAEKSAISRRSCDHRVGATGFEPTPDSSANSLAPTQSGAELCALDAKNARLDSRLLAIVRALRRLDPATRDAITRAAGG